MKDKLIIIYKLQLYIAVYNCNVTYNITVVNTNLNQVVHKLYTATISKITCLFAETINCLFCFHTFMRKYSNIATNFCESSYFIHSKALQGLNLCLQVYHVLNSVIKVLQTLCFED